MHCSKWQLVSQILGELGQPGLQRPSFKQLTSALSAIVEGSGALSCMVSKEEAKGSALLLVTNLRGALSNLQSFQGAAFQLSCYQGNVTLSHNLMTPNSPVLSCKDGTSPHRRAVSLFCSCVSLLCSLLWIICVTDFHLPIMLESIRFQQRTELTSIAELVEVYARLLPVEQVSHSVAEAFLDSLHLHLIKPSKPLHGTLAGCHLLSQRSPPLDVTMAGWYLTDVVAICFDCLLLL